MRGAAAALAVIAAGCAARKPRPSPLPPASVKLDLLGVNDFHGALDEHTVLLKTSGGTTAEVRVGGGALLAAYLEKLRGQDPAGTIVLGAGDMWQGSMESNFFEGRPVVMLDDEIAYDATAVGNHEFDYGPAGPIALASPGDPASVRYGALEARMKEASFPFLAANVHGSEPGLPAFKPWIMLERKGVKVAVIGLSTEETPNTTQRPNVAGLSFDPPAPAVVSAAAEARASGAQVVVVTAHIGGECKRGSDPEDASTCKQDEEVMRLLAALPPGTIDALVGGHTHQFIANRIDGVPVIESGAYGVAIGHLELVWNPVTKKVTSTIDEPIPICRDVLVDTGSCVQPPPGTLARPKVAPASFLGGPISPDPDLDRMLAPFRQEVLDKKNEVIATADRAIAAGRGDASEIGALVTDEMRASTRRYDDVPDADFALQNSGGLRTGIAKGPVSYGAVYEVLPFDNVLSTMTVTGDQLTNLIGTVLRTGRVMQTSGLRVDVCGKDEKASVKLFDFATGKPLDGKKKYVIVWNDFLANGGDGTKDALAGLEPKLHPEHLLRDAVVEGLKAKTSPLNPAGAPLLDPKKPRIRFLPSCP